MSDYTPSTDFASKDALLTGNPAKIVKGTEFATEFSAIQTAIATKFDSSNIPEVTEGGTGATSASAARTNLKVVGQDGTEALITSVSGTNTITGTLSPAISAYVAGQTFRFVAAGANTGAVTLNINGLGAKAITKSGTTALEVGDIASGAAIQVVYDGTQFQLTSGAGGGAKAGGVLYENSTTLTSNYTLTTGKNAMMAGPLTVDTGVTLTIPSGQRLVVL